jgi:hypothetical protein
VRWKLETGNWKLEIGKWKMETGNWKMERAEALGRPAILPDP